MSVLVVGSVALDTVEAPFGSVSDALGGSATYFSAAASLYTDVKLVAVVGTDFPPQHMDFFRRRGIDLQGLQVREGETFRWVGRYGTDLNRAQTLDTQLNVFATFHPVLTSAHADTQLVFLANIDPELQWEVRQQVPGARLVMMDTMDFWIEGKREALTRIMAAVDIVLMNEAEVRQYTGTYNLTAAARRILALGPRALIVKRGEYGCILFTPDSCFAIPAYPLEEVRDPTGAGDSFAGGFAGYLANVREITPAALRSAIVHGCVIASFAIEEFSVYRLASLQPDDIARRYREFQQFTHFGP